MSLKPTCHVCGNEYDQVHDVTIGVSLQVNDDDGLTQRSQTFHTKACTGCFITASYKNLLQSVRPE